MRPALDDVELPLALQCRIDAVFQRLDTMTHYDVLGVAPTAERKEISRAYLERTLEFQSTRYAGRSLGRYRAMMDAIYARVSEANQMLMSQWKRAAYDEEIRRSRLARVEQMLEDEERAMHGAAEKARVERISVPPVRTQSGVRPAVRVPDTATKARASSGK